MGQGEKIAEEYVNYLCEQAYPKTVPLNELNKATVKDQLLQIECIHNGEWYKYRGREEMTCHEKLSRELSVSTTA